jgi:hypothetical protein
MSPDLAELIAALIDGDRDRSLRIVADLERGGMRPVDLVGHGIEKAMAALDRKCTAEQFNLLEIMLAGRAVMAVIRHLFPADAQVPDPVAKVVVAVLEGDIHDIGKAILKVLLAGSRFQVIDCGKDVPGGRRGRGGGAGGSDGGVRERPHLERDPARPRPQAGAPPGGSRPRPRPGGRRGAEAVQRGGPRRRLRRPDGLRRDRLPRRAAGGPRWKRVSASGGRSPSSAATGPR